MTGGLIQAGHWTLNETGKENRTMKRIAIAVLIAAVAVAGYALDSVLASLSGKYVEDVSFAR